MIGFANYGVPLSHNEILTKLVNGLRRLENREYDSVGLALDIETSSDVVILKAVGSVDKLQALVQDTSQTRFNISRPLNPHVGIAHTRWATQCAPSITNRQPHVSDTNTQFVVAHNGIITNFKPLKAMLIAEGYSFDSDTDRGHGQSSEVLVRNPHSAS